ncbi:MAG: DEAD/DEAH box helicase, partial [Vicinamibacterales bacterium]|nr:DEAD/DEAH box helicase [Vicinamibacterales bacterium]
MPAAVVQADPIAFEKLGLDPALALGVQDRGFDAATPIQAAVFPIVSVGRDMIASAETGSGKTAAYLLPVLNRLLRQPLPARDAETTCPTKVLVLAPTRELVVQIEDDLQGFIYHTALTSAAVFGGTPIAPQAQALGAGVD